MPCKLNSECPYEKACIDCLYSVPGKRNKGNRRTGLDTSDMKAYKREYQRMIKQELLEKEMKYAGV